MARNAEILQQLVLSVGVLEGRQWAPKGCVRQRVPPSVEPCGPWWCSCRTRLWCSLSVCCMGLLWCSSTTLWGPSRTDFFKILRLKSRCRALLHHGVRVIWPFQLVGDVYTEELDVFDHLQGSPVDEDVGCAQPGSLRERCATSVTKGSPRMTGFRHYPLGTNWLNQRCFDAICQRIVTWNLHGKYIGFEKSNQLLFWGCNFNHRIMLSW